MLIVWRNLSNKRGVTLKSIIDTSIKYSKYRGGSNNKKDIMLLLISQFDRYLSMLYIYIYILYNIYI